MEDSRRDNPYATPSSTHELTSAELVVPHVEFAGVVGRDQLRSVLRSRISWSGLATFLIAALICFASDQSFALPGTIATLPSTPGLLGEILRVIGVGFLLLSVWHVVLTCTNMGVARREKSVLEFSPFLYEHETSGYLEKDHLFLRQVTGRAWLSWDAVGLCQLAGDVLMIDWTKGVVGNTVLTENMFASPTTFQQAAYQLTHYRGASSLETRDDESRYFSVSPTETLKSLSHPVAVVERHANVGTALWTAVLGIPWGVLSSSRPLHVFFSILVLVACLVTRQRVSVAATLLAVWAGIMVLACLLSIIQNREYFISTTPYSTRYTFFENEIHFETSHAYFVVHLEELPLISSSHDQFTLQQQGVPMQLQFSRDDFSDVEEFEHVKNLCGGTRDSIAEAD